MSSGDNSAAKPALREAFQSANMLLSVGSVDGVCTTAAVLRNARSNCGVEFCQAFTVDRVQPALWQPSRCVLVIGLAVNNRDEMMTAAFLRRVRDAGHKIIGVLDEHRADDWLTAFSRASLRFRNLLVKPVTGLKLGLRSSGALLLSLMQEHADEHTRELCEAADAADRMDFGTHLGNIVNRAIKPKLDDDSRRIYVARHLAFHRNPNATLQSWMAEYDEIERCQRRIISTRQDLGGGFIRLTLCGHSVDMTALLRSVYNLGCLVAVIDGEFFHQQAGRKVRQIAFGCAPGVRVNLAAALRSAGIATAGYRRKPLVALDDELAALEVVRQAVRSGKGR